MKIVQDYMSKQEDINEENISEYMTDFYNIRCTEKSKEEANTVGYIL